MPVLTGCATCKDRAIRCDRIKPKCTNCSQTNRKCHWQGIKLSWPRANDRRRAIVSKSFPSSSAYGRISDARFVHTTNWDLELYHKLMNSASLQGLSLRDPLVCWNPSNPKTFDTDLLEYFYHVASTSLATFGQNATHIAKILLQIGLQGKTPSSAALLQTIVAFSSLHRYGLRPQSVEAKITALGYLARGSVDASSGVIGALQHIGTCMLLCSFEVHQASCTSGQWIQYLEGVKQVIKTRSVTTLLEYCPDVVILLDWLYYYEILARFSLRYWNKNEASDLSFTPTDHFCPQISRLPPAVFSLLALLSKVVEIASSSGSPQLEPSRDGHALKNFVEVLDWRIRRLLIRNPADNDDDDDGNDNEYDEYHNDSKAAMKLYQLALLLYLNRSSEGRIQQHIRTQQHLDQAFAILPQMSSCKQQFPIYIIGCEARNDEQRTAIVDIIYRTENMSSSRSWTHCKGLLQAFWAQDDLAEWDTISYGSKLSSIMRLAKIVPAFV